LMMMMIIIIFIIMKMAAAAVVLVHVSRLLEQTESTIYTFVNILY
jgi:hypothetical protein